MILFVTSALSMEGPSLGEALPPPQFQFRAEVAGRGFVQVPDAAAARGFALPRARFSARVQATHGISGRFVTVASRSGGPAGAVGVDGEAFVPRVQIAEARIDAPAVGVSAAAGVVDDIWVGTHQPEWGLPEVAPTYALGTRVLDRADLGGWASFTAVEHRLSVSVAVTSGEGETRVERNDSVDGAAMVTVRPWVSDVGRLTARLYGRLGSRGDPERPNHRAGGSLRFEHAFVTAGAMTLAGWGSSVTPDQDPLLMGAHVRTGKKSPLVGYARFDQLWDDRADQESWTRVLRAGGGPRLPLIASSPLWLGVGWENRRGGQRGGADSDAFFVQLSVDVKADVPL